MPRTCSIRMDIIAFMVVTLVMCSGRNLIAEEVANHPVTATLGGRISQTARDEMQAQRLHPQLFRFVENRGQLADTDGNPVPEILYYADAGGARLYFHRDHVSIVFSRIEGEERGISEATGKSGFEENVFMTNNIRISYQRVDMEFAGCNPNLQLRASSSLPGYTNYYYAHCPEGITYVPGFAELVYTEIYQDIDLRFKIINGKLKYDFVVHPGGSVDDIRMHYDETTKVHTRIDGGLEISAEFGTIIESAPHTFQNKEGAIPSSFVIDGSEVGFLVQNYDRTLDLVIDPWATYLGGSDGEALQGVSIDGGGNVIVGGGTASTDFPVQQAIQSSFAGDGDGVMVKINKNGQLVWATYFGGSSGDYLEDISTNILGEVAAAGSTRSSNFPTKNAYQSMKKSSEDAFVLKLNSAGSLSWSTFIGGSQREFYGWLEMDDNGSVYSGTRTWSLDFPVKNAFQSAHASPGETDAVLYKFSATGSLEWSTYYGGSDDEHLHGMDVDENGNLLVSIVSWSNDIPLVNPTHTLASVGSDIIVARLTPTGNLIWATRYGGDSGDWAADIACGPSGMVAVTCRTNSSNIPLKNAIQSVKPGNLDALIAVYDSSGGFIMGSYLGGSDEDAGNDVAFDATGRIICVGSTRSTNFPVLLAQQHTYAGIRDAFITRFNTNGIVDWSTYYGGSKMDALWSVDTDQSGNVVAGGHTDSDDLTVQNAIQSTYQGGASDIFVLSVFSTGGTLLPPDPPSDLTGAPLTHTKAQLHWSDNSNSESAFVIEHHSGDHNWQIAARVALNSTSWTLLDLLPGHTHYFRIKAINSLYESDYSNTLELNMPPFPAPTNLAVDSVTFSTVLLRWQDHSTFEDHFVVEISENQAAWKDAVSVSEDSTSVQLTELTPSTDYFFRIRAVEGSVSSPYSNTTAVATQDLTAPINLQAAGHSAVDILLSWEETTDGETGFLIEFRSIEGNWGVVDTVSADVDEHLVGGLQPATTYEFRVRTLYHDIQSGASNIAQATTLLYLAAPTNLASVLMSESNIVLTWEDKADGETGFQIEHREDDGSWYLLRTTAANATMYDVKGLTPRTMHRFRVRAVGPNAASGYSNIIEIETRMAPAAPVNLLATAVDHKTIRITWQRGSANEDGYEVERKEEGGSWTFLTTAGPGDGDILDENLPLTTTFWYRVRATNDQGASGWSNEDSATTLDIPVPAAPFGLMAEATGPTSIKLRWAMPDPNTAEGFEVEISNTGDPGSFTHILPDPGVKDRTHTVTSLQSESKYYFRIRAVNRSGPSDYSGTTNATTPGANCPSVPENATATALSDTQIRLTWEMPDPSKEDGFRIERSLTGDEADFAALSPDLGVGVRAYIDSGLTQKTTYYYRLRAYNNEGASGWSDVVSATTLREPLPPALLAAITAKEEIISEVETLIPDGDAKIVRLRALLGDYARGYDEHVAKELIGDWKSGNVTSPTKTAEAMQRYVLFEEALRDSWGDEDAIPAVTGVLDLGSQCGTIPAVASKNLVALALSWKDERAFLVNEDPIVNAAMEDMILALSDNLQQLLMLTGADREGELAILSEEIIRGRGEVEDLDAALMLPMLGYWQEHMLGRYYLPATQPLIATFSGRTEQVDYAGTQTAAAGKRDGFLTDLRAEIGALEAGFSDYGRIRTSLDKAYAIGQTAGSAPELFLLQVKNLRPPLTDNMYKALADAAISTERFLYMTSEDAVPGLGSVPSALRDAGEAIFDPTQGGIVQREDPLAVFSKTAVPAANPLIDVDFAVLQELRTKVEESDTEYITDEFDAIRRSGKHMISEVDRLQRTLLGVDRAELYQDEILRGDYYYTLARMQLLKTRRTVLSVALAEYMLTPDATKQTDLIAEIDSIIGPFSDAQDLLSDLTSDVGSIIKIPALSLENADIVRDETVSPQRCHIRFDVKNVGGAEATDPTAAISFLSAGVSAAGSPEYSFATLQTDAKVRDSLEVDIDAGVEFVTLSVQMETGGRVFTDRRTLRVPEITTSVAPEHSRPGTCILHQNYPNPFNPTTTISFELPRPMTVSLIVTDALGREVWTAGGRRQEAGGQHSVTFDASGLPSGIYFYRLETADAVLVKKMVLMR